MNALAQLVAWSRKYYHFEIRGNGYTQSGTGHSVRLWCSNRGVRVDDHELGDDTSLEDVILEALRRWHEDKSSKCYLIVYKSKIDPPWGHKLLPATFAGMGGRVIDEPAECAADEKLYVSRVSDYSEELAKEILFGAYEGKEQPTLVQIWEVNESWNH